MNNAKSVDLLANPKKSAKKSLPPPLRLPASNEEKLPQSNEQTSSTNHCCSSSKDCSHASISYTLPISQRSQILDTLVDSSSTLLLPSSSSSLAADPRHKKSHFLLNSQQINFLKQRYSSRQNAIQENEWLEFLHSVLQKPFESELQTLLDKYKVTYFDRVNSPNTTDATIRAALCDMVSQTLATYSSGEQNSSSLPTTDTTTTATTQKPAKRKRTSCERATIHLNKQTKFVICHLIPGQDEKLNSNQQRLKQFQKKFHNLFRYIPNANEQMYLIRLGHLKDSADNQICLMLHDEVLLHMEKSDLQISGIAIDQSFTLDESILENMKSNI